MAFNWWPLDRLCGTFTLLTTHAVVNLHAQNIQGMLLSYYVSHLDFEDLSPRLPSRRCVIFQNLKYASLFIAVGANEFQWTICMLLGYLSRRLRLSCFVQILLYVYYAYSEVMVFLGYAFIWILHIWLCCMGFGQMAFVLHDQTIRVFVECIWLAELFSYPRTSYFFIYSFL